MKTVSNKKEPRSELKSKLTFLLGIFVGYFLLRSSLFEVLEQNLTQTTTWILFQTNNLSQHNQSKVRVSCLIFRKWRHNFKFIQNQILKLEELQI